MSSVPENAATMKPPPVSESSAEGTMNLALLDPPRWGWTAGGGVSDILAPHERSRRRSTCLAYKKDRRRKMSALGGNQNGSSTPGPSLAQTPSSNSSIATPTNLLASSAVGAPEVSTPAAAAQDPGGDIGESSSDSQCTGAAASALPTGPAAVALPSVAAAVPPAFSTPATESSKPNNKLGATGRKIHWKTLEKMNRANGLSRTNAGDKFGIEHKFLGMSIAKDKRKKAELADLPSSKPPARERFQCTVDAIKDGVLDMYSYHRGREGMEPRDTETGELLCSQEVTDTNHDWDAPKMVANVLVRFPLEDNVEGSGDDDAQRPMFHETIDWDLSDKSTKSPANFASDIAEEFGLSFGQMMDLALSIQQQIDAFVQQHFSYSAPLAYKDPNGNERRYAGRTLYTQRYGQVLSVREGGTRLEKREVAAKRGSGPASAASHGEKSSAGASSSAARRKSAERITEVLCDEPLEEVEDAVRDEVLNRARSASIIDVGTKCKGDAVVGTLERKLDFHCHICHKKNPVAYAFACGVVSHAYCEMHCKTRFGIGQDNGIFVFDYCPICCLACTCSKCRRKLDSVSRAFKKACDSQGVKYEDAKFDDILDQCERASHTQRRVIVVDRKKDPDETVDPNPALLPTAQSDAKVAAKPRKSGGRGDGRKHAMVPKAPLTDFPREVCGLIELEPGSPDDYLKVYTNEGSYVVEDFPESWTATSRGTSAAGDSFPRSEDGEAMEDGNVDFCNECESHGSLLCCDTCPRAFHKQCVQEKTRLGSDELWQCPVCVAEKEERESDIVTGEKSMDLISATFLNINPADEGNLKAMHLLSKIHEMLLKLMDYDFGYMFAQPVGNVEGYKNVVKTPMDLGTICAKLINGSYSTTLEPGTALEDVVLAVLKDIELVWHNCYNFNYDGSAVYRMAAVVSRRAQMICRRSFESELSENVKNGVRQYVAACELERGMSKRSSGSTVLLTEEEKALRARKPRGKHKITVKVKSGTNRPVAVIDPSLGRVVKIYATIKTAAQAVLSLSSLGHRSEWHSTSDFKTLVQRSANDTSLLIFGYRWVMLDSLRQGKVKFPVFSADLIELKSKDSTFLFMSVEEALSFSNLPKKTKISQLRESLEGLDRGADWVEHGGLQWRRPELTKQTQTLTPCNDDEEASGMPSKVPNSKGADVSDFCAIVKEDLVSGRKLVGFPTPESAYQDWVQSVMCSPAFPKGEAKSIQHFKEFYLSGDRNIDGLYWRLNPLVSNGGLKQTCPTDDTTKTSEPQLPEKPGVKGALPTPKNGVTLSKFSEDQVPQMPKASSSATDPVSMELSVDQNPGKRKRLDDDNGQSLAKKKVNGTCVPQSGGSEGSPFPPAVPLVERQNVGDATHVET